MAARGRKSKTVEAIRKLALHDSPEGQKANNFRVDLDLPVVEGDTPAQKEQELVLLVADRLNKLRNSPRVSESAPAYRRAWIEEDTPEKVITRLRQESFFNTRIIETLEQHLAMSIIAQGSIDRQIATAREELAGEMDDLPKTLQKFIRGLNLAGLKATAVAGFTQSDYENLARRLNERFDDSHPQTAQDVAEVARSSNRVTSEQLDISDRETQVLKDMFEAKRVETPQPQVLDQEIILPLYGQEWIDPAVDVPEEFWCSDLEFDMPYRWEYREATQEEFIELLVIPMPPADSWARMVAKDREFRKAFTDKVVDVKMTADLLQLYLGHVYQTDVDSVPVNAVKAWMYVLWARTQPDAVKALMGEEHRTYFAGVKLRVITMGASMIRVLVPIDQLA